MSPGSRLFYASGRDAARPAFPAGRAPRAERVVVCTGIEEREPEGGADRFPSDVGRVYCFSELTGVEADAYFGVAR